MSNEREPLIVIVGGFLAAGKTTLILAAGQELTKRGLRIAALFNDQGRDLVDSHYAASIGVRSGEVVGGCFCCRLTDLVEQVKRLQEFAPDVIFAEPVGSCTDLAATIIRPLRELRWEKNIRFRLAPLTVLVDPARARELLADSGDISMRFLFEKQIQEADIICMTKSDVSPSYPEVDAVQVRQISSRTGQGVAAWLDEILGGTIVGGERALAIDYEQYAKAEAALAWLNLRAELKLSEAHSPAMLLGPFLDAVSKALHAAGIPIAHLKAIISGPAGLVKATIAAHGQEPELEGDLDASPAYQLELLLNLRAAGGPAIVGALVQKELQSLNEGIVMMNIDCFQPGTPVPERRIFV
jgi:Ni2+-binding GTPase involved in maturation of urease and hydrogenase